MPETACFVARPRLSRLFFCGPFAPARGSSCAVLNGGLCLNIVDYRSPVPCSFSPCPTCLILAPVSKVGANECLSPNMQLQPRGRLPFRDYRVPSYFETLTNGQNWAKRGHCGNVNPGKDSGIPSTVYKLAGVKDVASDSVST